MKHVAMDETALIFRPFCSVSPGFPPVAVNVESTFLDLIPPKKAMAGWIPVFGFGVLASPSHNNLAIQQKKYTNVGL